MMKNGKLVLLIAFLLLLFFTFWFAIPFSLSRSEDARMARAFDTDEADLCELIFSSINENQDFTFNAYGAVYYKPGIFVLKQVKRFAEVEEQTVLVFFRLYSWLFFIGFVAVLVILCYRLTGFYGALFALVLSFVVSPGLLHYSAMLHPDVAQLFFITLGLWMLYLFVDSRKIVYLFLASVSAALAFSCKYSGLLLLPSVYAAVFLVKTNTNQPTIRKAIRAIITIALLILTWYLFDDREISKYIQGSSVGNELLFYIKVTRYGSLVVVATLTAVFLFSVKSTKPVFAGYFIEKAFLFITASWLFLGTYLLTVINLLPDYKFLAGFLDVTNFHSLGHNFIEEGGLANWYRVMTVKEVFGFLFFPAFLLSMSVLVFRIKELSHTTLIVFTLFVLWQFIFLGFVVFRVRSMWGHFLLPAIPVMIIPIVYLFFQSLKCKNSVLKYGLITVLLVLLTERCISTIGFCIDKKAEEQNSAAIEAGKWLLQHADSSAIISANNYCYIPKVFSNVTFNWGTELEDLYSENIDYIVTHAKVLDDFADSSLAGKYMAGTESYLNRYRMRKALLSENNGHFNLIRDFGGVKIFKRHKSSHSATLFYSLSSFENVDTPYWNIDKSGIDSITEGKGSNAWHFTSQNEWGPTFHIGLDTLTGMNEYLISVKAKVYSVDKSPAALLITQLKDNEEMIHWKKTNIVTQNLKPGKWVTVYANLIVTKTQTATKGLIFSAYFWNLNRNDFWIDDFEVVIRPL